MEYKIALKILLVSVEAFLLLLFIIPFFRNVVNTGNILGTFACTALLAITIFSDNVCKFIKCVWHTAGGKVGIIAVCVIITAGVIYAVILSALMLSAYNNPPDKPNAVVVLGCRVKGTTPSQMLRYRLDAAYEYLTENEGVICVVSGGQGSGEDIPEAQAMKEYLVQRGISPDRIITEDKSTTTAENLSFTADILTELGLPLEVTIITDGYHQYRARLIAMEVGYDNVYSVSGYTKPYLLPTYWVREWLAITAEFIW